MYYCCAGHAAFIDRGSQSQSLQQFTNLQSVHARQEFCLRMLRISGAATDIRSFLANEATSSFPISNLPSSCNCPLPPWQYALIALASLHVLCIIINISVQCPLTSPRACFGSFLPIQIMYRRTALTPARICFALVS